MHIKSSAQWIHIKLILLGGGGSRHRKYSKIHVSGLDYVNVFETRIQRRSTDNCSESYSLYKKDAKLKFATAMFGLLGVVRNYAGDIRKNK